MEPAAKRRRRIWFWGTVLEPIFREGEYLVISNSKACAIPDSLIELFGQLVPRQQIVVSAVRVVWAGRVAFGYSPSLVLGSYSGPI